LKHPVHWTSFFLGSFFLEFQELNYFSKFYFTVAMVVECLPSPLEVTEERVEKLLCSNARKFDSLPEQTQQLKDGE